MAKVLPSSRLKTGNERLPPSRVHDRIAGPVRGRRLPSSLDMRPPADVQSRIARRPKSRAGTARGRGGCSNRDGLREAERRSNAAPLLKALARSIRRRFNLLGTIKAQRADRPGEAHRLITRGAEGSIPRAAGCMGQPRDRAARAQNAIRRPLEEFRQKRWEAQAPADGGRACISAAQTRCSRWGAVRRMRFFCRRNRVLALIPPASASRASIGGLALAALERHGGGPLVRVRRCLGLVPGPNPAGALQTVAISLFSAGPL